MDKMWNEVIANENWVMYSKPFPSEGENNKVLYWTHAVKLVLSIWKDIQKLIIYFCVFQRLSVYFRHFL